MESKIAEFLQFLTPSAREDVKGVALQTLLDLTGTSDGTIGILKNQELLKSLIEVLKSDTTPNANCVLSIFINISADEDGCVTLHSLSSPSLVETILTLIFKDSNNNSENACKLVNNLSRSEFASQQTFQRMKNLGFSLNSLVNILCDNKPEHASAVHYLAGLLSNLSQHKEVRSCLMNKENDFLIRLLSFTNYQESDIRRNGIVGVIRNCCFDCEYHSWLLSDDIDILPHLLLPLAGPEEFTEDEMSELPLELQYLGDDKQREVQPEIRKKLLEALTQLCATKRGREILRQKQAYLILRELHKWEKVPTVQFACENVVQILIGDEPDSEMENLKSVDVPSDLTNKFQEEDEQYNSLNDSDQTLAT